MEQDVLSGISYRASSLARPLILTLIVFDLNSADHLRKLVEGDSPGRGGTDVDRDDKLLRRRRGRGVGGNHLARE